MVGIVDREELRRKLKEKSKQSRERTNEILTDELEALRSATHADLDALRPKVSDPETYAELIRIVEASTSRNENLAQLQERLKKAGKAVRSLAKEVVGLLGPAR